MKADMLKSMSAYQLPGFYQIVREYPYPPTQNKMKRKCDILQNMIRRIVDVCMTVLLLLLMAYQVTGEVVHEWVGMP